MLIREAKNDDIDGILRLLSQVLEIHAKIRPDIFISGTTKYTKEELLEILTDKTRPIYIAADENGSVLGYAFCIIQEAASNAATRPQKSLYIDDLCVDSSSRGKGIGKSLFEYVKSRAKMLGCIDITLAVWEGNDSARVFYEKMGMKPRKTVMDIKAD